MGQPVGFKGVANPSISKGFRQPVGFKGVGGRRPVGFKGVWAARD